MLSDEDALGLLDLQVDNLQFHLEVRERGNSATIPLSLPLAEVPQFVNDDTDAAPPPMPRAKQLTDQPRLTIESTLSLRFDDGRALDLRRNQLFGPMVAQSQTGAPPPMQRLACPLQLPQPASASRFESSSVIISGWSDSCGADTESPLVFSCAAFRLAEDEFMTTLGRLYFLCKKLYTPERLEFEQVRDAVGPWETLTCRARDGTGFVDCSVTLGEICEFRQDVINRRYWRYCSSLLVGGGVTTTATRLQPSCVPRGAIRPACLTTIPLPAVSRLSPAELHQLWTYAATPRAMEPKAPLCVQKCAVAEKAIRALAEGNFAIKELIDALRRDSQVIAAAAAAKEESTDSSAAALLPLRVLALTGNGQRLRAQMLEFVSGGAAPSCFEWLVLRMEAATCPSEFERCFDDAAASLHAATAAAGPHPSCDPASVARCVFETPFLGLALQRRWLLPKVRGVIVAILDFAKAASPPVSQRLVRKLQLVLFHVSHQLGASGEQLQPVVLEIFGTFNADAEAFQKDENNFSDIPSPASSLQLVDGILRALHKTSVFFWYAIFMDALGKAPYARHLFTLATRLSPPSLADAVALRSVWARLYEAKDFEPVFAPLGLLDDALVAFRGRAHWQCVFARLGLLCDYRKSIRAGFAVERLQDHLGLLAEMPKLLPGSTVNAPTVFANAVAALLFMVEEGFAVELLKGDKKRELWTHAEPHVTLAEGLCASLAKSDANLAVGALHAKLKYASFMAFREVMTSSSSSSSPSESSDDGLVTALSLLAPLSDGSRFIGAAADAIATRLQLLREVIGNVFSAHAGLMQSVSIDLHRLAFPELQMLAASSGGSGPTSTHDYLVRPLPNFVEFLEVGQPGGFCAPCENFVTVASLGNPHLLPPWHLAYTERNNTGYAVFHCFPSAASTISALEAERRAEAILKLFADVANGLLALHDAGLAHNRISLQTIVAPRGDAELFTILLTGNEVGSEQLLPPRPPQEQHKPVADAAAQLARAALRERQANDFDALARVIEQLAVDPHSASATAEAVSACKSDSYRVAVEQLCVALALRSTV